MDVKQIVEEIKEKMKDLPIVGKGMIMEEIMRDYIRSNLRYFGILERESPEKKKKAIEELKEILKNVSFELDRIATRLLYSENKKIEKYEYHTYTLTGISCILQVLVEEIRKFKESL